MIAASKAGATRVHCEADEGKPSEIGRMREPDGGAPARMIGRKPVTPHDASAISRQLAPRCDAHGTAAVCARHGTCAATHELPRKTNGAYDHAMGDSANSP